MLLLPSRSFNLNNNCQFSSNPHSRSQHLFPKRSLRPKRLSMFSNNSRCSSPFKYNSSSNSLFNSRNTTFIPKLLLYQFNPLALHSSNKPRHHLLRSCIKCRFLGPPLRLVR